MKLRYLNSVAILAIMLVNGLQAGSSTSSEVVKADMPGIVNFSYLDDSAGFAGPLVGFGGTTDPAAMALLKEKGFNTVINLRKPTEEGADVKAGKAAAQAAGLNYESLPLDPKTAGPEEIQLLMETLGNASNQPVYLHCGSATRVAAIWMIARILEDDWEFDRAQQEAESIAQKPDQAIAFATSYLETHNPPPKSEP